MGLDMYAYTLRKELADKSGAGHDTSNWQTDFDPSKAARRAVGFLDLTDDELLKLTDAGRQAYYAAQRKATDLATFEGFYDRDFAYWRKFNALHGWMHELYTQKGGTDEAFNCNTVRLMPEDVDKLESDAKAGNLRPTAGLFFGSQDEFSDEDRDEVLAFCAKCREAFAAGNAVYYDSWW